MKCVIPMLGLLVAVVGAMAEEPRKIRKPIAEFATEKAESGPDGLVGIIQADLSRDGKAVACWRGNGRFTGVSKLTLYSVENAKPLFTTELTDHNGSPYSSGVTFSADSKLLAFHVQGKQIEVRTTETGKLHASVELPGKRRETVDALTFSPGGDRLAVASGGLYHKDLHVFEIKSGKLLSQPLKNVDGMAYQLLFAADGKRLFANHSNIIYLVDAVEFGVVKLKANARTIYVQQDKMYAVQEESAAVHEVTADGIADKAVGRFAEKAETVNTFRMAVEGTPAVAAVPVKNEVSVRNVDGKELYRVIGEDSPIRRLCLSADAKVLMVYRDSQRVEVFRLE